MASTWTKYGPRTATCYVQRTHTTQAMPEPSGPSIDAPRRGEVWFADLSPTQGHEQAGRRPILIISTNAYNAGHSGMVIALPLTSRIRPLASHVRVRPPEGGLKVVSDILCGQVRALSRDR